MNNRVTLYKLRYLRNCFLPEKSLLKFYFLTFMSGGIYIYIDVKLNIDSRRRCNVSVLSSLLTIYNQIMTVSFDIIICGGGLAGLACAIGLVRAGHRVTVLESTRELSEVGAGIQVPPNSVRILKEYGIYDKFTNVVTRPESIVIKRYENGQTLNSTPLDPEMTEKYGNPYLLIHRADYLKILYELAVEAGVVIKKNSRVVEVDGNIRTVTLKNGDTYTGDLIIGADGIKSNVRDSAVVTEETVLPLPSSYCAYRVTIPGEVMAADPVISHLMTEIKSTCWIGYRRHIMAYPIRDGTLYNMVMIHPGQAAVGVWNEPADLEEMRNHFKDWDPVVCQLLSHVDKSLKWVLADMPRLPRWVKGRVALIGDAAHSMLPFLAQGAAQGIEDGATLVNELEKISKVEEIDQALVRYEKRRMRRVHTIQAGARSIGETWHLPDGDDQVERDIKMKAKEDHNPNKWSDNEFQHWLFGWNAFTD